ncbi:hypothetical protein H7J07_06015 [Mycobacterium koreense]|nr:hypothetical protein [Mycolicibacillus koreensis]MCV7247782.1 hypothetical protein [Mycolicibacillus koreensis]
MVGAIDDTNHPDTGDDPVAAQLADELGAAVGALARVAGGPAATEWPAALAGEAPRLAHRLCGGDAHRAAETAAHVMGALWPMGAPETVGAPRWWSTPLGLACAHALGPQHFGAVTHKVAAEILGVTLGTVKQLAHRGTIAKRPDGLSLAAVLARLQERTSS